jgi:hypothetical protein
MNPLSNTAEVQSFLNTFPSPSRRRGKHYFGDGAVIEVSCVEAGRRYAAVVRGTEDYAVSLVYEPDDGGWEAGCSCPVGFECKHAFAAMMALSVNADKLSAPTAPAAKSKRYKKQQVTISLQTKPKAAGSPLEAALEKALKRRLDREEGRYVDYIKWLYGQARGGYGITVETLRVLAPALRDYSWTPLTLWRELPQDDWQCWLYCAWEMRRRGLGWPKFMQPVTDLSRIEPQMHEWEREKQIETWRANLADEDVDEAAQESDEVVDFRIVILPHQARVQWKTGLEKDYKDLKQTRLRQLVQQQEAGTLNVTPESGAIWAAIYQPYDFKTTCHFDFDQPETSKVLGRVLRLAGAQNHVVTAEGTPLERLSEPLRYQVEPATSELDDYRVTLVRPDGSPAPPILLALPGRPALYLGERAVFTGPPQHNFGLREPLRIPAPALECADGVRFLQRLNVELPARIAQRTRRMAVAVKVSCRLKPTYVGSSTEALDIQVTAKVEGGGPERCATWGWDSVNYSGRQRRTPKSDGFIPVVDRSLQAAFPRKLEELSAKWDDYSASWRVRLSKTFPEVFLSWLESLPPGVEVLLDEELSTLRNAPISGSVRLDLEEAEVDWFDLKVALNVSDTELTPDELKLLLNARGGYVRLGKKGWRRLHFDLSEEDDARLARLGLNPRDFTAEPQRLHALQLADESARKFLPEAQAEAIHRRAAELKTRVTPPVPGGIGAELRPYQIEGFHFLAYLTANRFGGVLADDMGLGKTLQTLTWLAWLREHGAAGTPGSNGYTHDNGAPAADAKNVSQRAGGPGLLPSLVVCPKSVMDNWRSEARRFCAGLRVRVWQGETADALVGARSEADLVVVNYSQLRGLSPEIAQHRWQLVILDEAQYIKNPDSQTAQIARTLQADHRLALTGTPIENRLLDLWSIFSFSMPGVLGNRAQFTKRFNQQNDPFARQRLAARVRPFLLRRTKGQVAKDLPDRVEEDIVCELEGEQKTLYRAEFKRAQQMLLNVHTQQELNDQRFNFLTSLLRLRQICCHPALVSEELRQAESAKLNALLELLEPLMEEGHKVLVFSQFVTMLDILRETVKARGWTHFYLSGATENRGELVEKFQTTEGAAVFLISLKAGGFGLNLTAASYVVLFDPWWNPAVEMQAIDRTHRIGQTSKVMAYRLLMKDSIEQKIRQLQRAKAALAQDVLGEEKFSQSLTLEDLRFLFAGD